GRGHRHKGRRRQPVPGPADAPAAAVRRRRRLLPRAGRAPPGGGGAGGPAGAVRRRSHGRLPAAARRLRGRPARSLGHGSGRGAGMNWVALRMLTGDRSKYLGIIFGVTFATLLMSQQMSIFAGIMARTGSQIVDVGEADIWVMDSKVRFI